MLFLCQVTLLLEFCPPSSGALPRGPNPRVTPLAAVTREQDFLRARRQVLQPRGLPLSPPESREKGRLPRDCERPESRLRFSYTPPCHSSRQVGPSDSGWPGLSRIIV